MALEPLSSMAQSISIGATYEHYKRKQYTVLGVARDSETLKEMVVYQALYGEKHMWVRSVEMFVQMVEVDGKTEPRFQQVCQHSANKRAKTGETEETKQDATFEFALQTFFNNNLMPGMAYGCVQDPDRPGHWATFTKPPEKGLLMYQDGAGGFGWHAYSDVFRMPDDTYMVQTDTEGSSQMGGKEEQDIFVQPCATLFDVLQELVRAGGPDPNTCRKMLDSIYGKEAAKHAAKDISKLPKSTPSTQALYETSVRGDYRHPR